MSLSLLKGAVLGLRMIAFSRGAGHIAMLGWFALVGAVGAVVSLVIDGSLALVAGVMGVLIVSVLLAPTLLLSSLVDASGRRNHANGKPVITGLNAPREGRKRHPAGSARPADSRPERAPQDPNENDPDLVSSQYFETGGSLVPRVGGFGGQAGAALQVADIDLSESAALKLGRLSGPNDDQYQLVLDLVAEIAADPNLSAYPTLRSKPGWFVAKQGNYSVMFRVMRAANEEMILEIGAVTSTRDLLGDDQGEEPTQQ